MQIVLSCRILNVHATADRRKTALSMDCTFTKAQRLLSTLWISPKRTIYDAFVQKRKPPKKKDLRFSYVQNLKKNKTNTQRKKLQSSYVVLIGDILLLKTAWVHFDTRQHGTSAEHLGAGRSEFPGARLPRPEHSDCQCSEAKSETFSKAVWSKQKHFIHGRFRSRGRNTENS